jgi:hypothetical protein
LKLRVPYLVQDPRIGLEIEHATFDGEDFCLDGPVTRRVAVVHFDAASGELCPGVPFVPPAAGRPGGYRLADPGDPTAGDFLCVNAFATVLDTLYMFQEPDALGREVEWAFGAPQLLVVPRAGEWPNAFYQRESHSLQFFHFPARTAGGEARTVFTALSQDILAHETAHAVLDGVAPDLYHCLTPQSLALHEAVADLTALLVAVRSPKLRERLLNRTGGEVAGQQAFSQLAEEFGFERDRTGRARHLRSLWNERNLCPDDDSLDDLNRRNQVDRGEPHLLSEVLSGALYRVFCHLHREYRSRRAAEQGTSELSASGFALFVAAQHFKRLVLRSLDYLPPGEVSFADYGRAILASDQASYAERSEGRERLVEEFVRRCVVAGAAELAVDTDYAEPALAAADLETLVASDWAAYDFVERHRELFGVPAGVRFRVRPRLVATKRYYAGGAEGGLSDVKELIFKVSWDRVEDNPRDLPVSSLRQITVGTTLVVDWETQRVRALLVADAAAPPEASPAAARQLADRDLMLRRLVGERRLRFGSDAPADLGDAVRAESSGDVMRIRGAGRMLHLADRWEDDEEAADG